MEPLTAALSALAVVAACSVYTLLVLPESLTLKARAVVRGCRGPGAVRV